MMVSLENIHAMQHADNLHTLVILFTHLLCIDYDVVIGKFFLINLLALHDKIALCYPSTVQNRGANVLPLLDKTRRHFCLSQSIL